MARRRRQKEERREYKATVIIPYRDSIERRPVLDHVLKLWEERFPEFAVIVAPDSDEGPWRKGLAVENGLRAAATEVIVVADADSWSPRVGEAVDLVLAGAPWYMPHTTVVRLKPDATGSILVGENTIEEVAKKKGARLGEPVNQATVGGVIVLRADVLRNVPIDPRFEGWGGEDLAHRFALTTLVGKRRRLDGEMIHLWHPPASGSGALYRPTDGRTLRHRYARANGKSAEMRAIVNEAKIWFADNVI